MVDDRPHVVVVGAGLAGLGCADRLTSAARVTVLEARDRVGGRCWSSRGWADGQVAEHGGELIEEGQAHVLRLVDELGLELESRQPATPPPGALALGGEVGDLDRVGGLPDVLARLVADHAAIVPGRLARSRQAVELDEMSAHDWLDAHVEGGTGSSLGRALALAVTINLGLPTDRLSALSLHHMFLGMPDATGGDAFAFGNDTAATDAQLGDVLRAGTLETFHVAGGNDLLATGLAGRLPPGCLRLEAPLTALARRPDGRYDVRAAGGGPLVADRVVLATPLPPLRRVDLAGAGLSDRRLELVEQLPMATHRKLLVQVDRRPALDPAWPGVVATDAPPIVVWDTSAGQAGDAGLLTFFTPQPWPAATVAHGVAHDGAAAAAALLADLAPGLEIDPAAPCWLDDWAADPWSGGSYAAFGPGQYTRFADLLPVPEGGIHFAGEHTSLSGFGYLDGALGSGRRAAAEVLASLSRRPV